ncbi:hypothetical protein [Pseudoalteromonas piscicida]|uniref:Uncharacterized protein n=1 Tax=Pseudoalteromonas piscicida TaxID=43662 RepID=A0AAD0RKS0_PSEO7|nr:hypothetical protein [Pseudoalteromonas piscicida]ASD68949.1 hypothetical protein B1L02_18640 [Pseudoalteromonas piscicida]AXR04677.1 hypothetical protein D0511_22680 [Pseudoalteromonas piscicida]
MNQALKFLLSIIIVIVTFVVSATLAGMLAEYAGWWKKPVIGGVAAACVVLSGYFSAPVYKFYSAAIWLLIGAVAAWVMSSVFMYAEDAETSVPLYVTYVSGVVALVLCWSLERRKVV